MEASETDNAGTPLDSIMKSVVLPQILRGGLLSIAVLVLFCSPSPGQTQGGNNGNQGGNQNNQNNASGILIDAAGTVTPGFVQDQTSRLNQRLQQTIAARNLPATLQTSSSRRNVSLVRLERAIERQLDAGEPPGEEFRSLAGLGRIDTVLIDREGRDIIISGPAEPFAPDGSGRPRGIQTGRPPLQLDDLLIALRHVPQARNVGCSIDPRAENLAAFQNYVRQNSTAAVPAVIEQRFRKMAEILGLHDVRIMGVPDDSHFGRVLVEADYRMKRISLGLEDPEVRNLRSHLALLRGGGNSLQRWWFVPLFSGLYCDAGRTVFEVTGPRVQVLSQEELADYQGQRQAAATTRLTTQAFSRQFTELYEKLANQSPVFAELQNLVDLSVLVALLHQEQAFDQVRWQPGLLTDAARLPTDSGAAPRQVPALFNLKRLSGSSIIGLVGGGVSIDVRKEIRAERWKVDPARRLESVRQQPLEQRPANEDRWWWDTIAGD